MNIRNLTVSDGVAHSNFIIPCYHISDNPSIWLWPGAILVLQQNCAYLVTFDLDLENIVDADRPGDHFVQVWWWSVHLPMSRSNLSATTKLPIFCDLWPWAKCGCGCAYLVTFDLDLENIVDADRPGDHFVLWHCWLGHISLTRKIVSDMTYIVSSGTLNPTILYYTLCKFGEDPFTYLWAEAI